MSVRIESSSTPISDTMREQIVAVYQAAFHAPPYNEPPEATTAFGERLARHSFHSGFRYWSATDTQTQHLVAFAYGYLTAPGQWWHDTVVQSLEHAQVDRWFTNAFELVELAVVPPWQAQGIGSQLHHAIVGAVEQQSIIASTLQNENPAVQFYLRHGWTIIQNNFLYPGSLQPSVILGYRTQKR